MKVNYGLIDALLAGVTLVAVVTFLAIGFNLAAGVSLIIGFMICAIIWSLAEKEKVGEKK